MKFSLEEDKWLSNNLGKAAFKLQLSESGEDLADLMLNLPSPSFSYIKVKPENVRASAKLAEAGFFLADTNVVLEMPVEDLINLEDSRVREAKERDFSSVGNVAEKSFTWTRFHQDFNIQNSIADNLKRQWAENFFKGERGTHMFVAETDGEIAGFNQLIVRGSETIIDLIGVLPAHQKKELVQDLFAQ